MKGIIITALNRSTLGQTFNIEQDDYDDLLPIGYTLIAEFGDGWNEGVVPQATFDLYMDRGANLLNGWFVVTKK